MWSKGMGVLVLFAVYSVAGAQYMGEGDLYRRALRQIVEHEEAKQFLVWDQSISAAVLASERVPRQIPQFQFTRSLPATTAGLKLALLYSSIDARDLSGKAYSRQLKKFDLNSIGGRFLGFADQKALRQLDLSAGQFDADQKPLVVGFSNIGFKLEDGRMNALLYAESGLLGGESYGGECFLFVKQGNDWQLKGHAYLWQGASIPFWKW